VTAEHTVADAKLASADVDRFRAEPASAEHERVGCVVEIADVVAPVGEHHRSANVVLSGLPPVLE
jgi:hypothetical protein